MLERRWFLLFLSVVDFKWTFRRWFFGSFSMKFHWILARPLMCFSDMSAPRNKNRRSFFVMGCLGETVPLGWGPLNNQPHIHLIYWVFIGYIHLPGTPNYHLFKWMFGETTISHVKICNHPIETTMKKWLFGVPGGHGETTRFFVMSSRQSYSLPTSRRLGFGGSLP